jgi:hypothetical protein
LFLPQRYTTAVVYECGEWWPSKMPCIIAHSFHICAAFMPICWTSQYYINNIIYTLFMTF